MDHRRHVINRVYANSDSDFLFLGHFEVRTKNGKEFDDDFAGQVVIDDPHSTNPKIRYFKAFVVRLHAVLAASLVVTSISCVTDHMAGVSTGADL